jgi:hypothetical protein
MSKNLNKYTNLHQCVLTLSWLVEQLSQTYVARQSVTKFISSDVVNWSHFIVPLKSDFSVPAREHYQNGKAQYR